MLLFPFGGGRQTSPPPQRFASRASHPGRDAHLLAGGRSKDALVNFRIDGYRELGRGKVVISVAKELTLWTCSLTAVGSAIGSNKQRASIDHRRQSMRWASRTR